VLLGIDFGTSSARLVKKKQGVLQEEPSLVALDRNSQRILAVGSQAQQVFGKAPGSIVAVPAFRGGVIADVRATYEVLRKLIRSATGRSPLKPVLHLSVATSATVVERRSLIEVALQAGAKEARLIPSPLAAARGGGLDTDRPRGRLLVGIGGGITEVALISMGSILLSETEPSGGEAVDEMIQRHVRQAYSLLIGLGASEDVKRNQIDLWERPRNGCNNHADEAASSQLQLSGLGVVDGLPRTVELDQGEILAAIEPQLKRLLALLRRVLEQTPPELAADICEDGIYLAGGGSLLKGLAEAVSSSLGVTARVLPNPQHCVALGVLS
jgi:rod shape-determining protein MreB